jgi:hypothetical protein
MLNNKVWAVLSLPVLLFALLLVLGGGTGGNGGSISLMGGELREIDRFRRAQARLERATGAVGPRLGVKAMVAHNMAEGDGLEAEMMERRSAGRRFAAFSRQLAPLSSPPSLVSASKRGQRGFCVSPGGGRRRCAVERRDSVREWGIEKEGERRARVWSTW